MSTKIVSIFLSMVILTSTHLAHAQQAKKIPRIGWLSQGYVRSERSPRSEAFLQGLRDLGYVEGQNIFIEHRSGERKDDRLPHLAAELVRLKVDVIVALELPAARAAKNATKTIPIVMRSGGDPVKAGFVASLARPGGNITGLTSISGELYGKRLGLLKEIVRGLSRVAVLWNPDFPSGPQNFKEMEAEAKPLGIQLRSSEARSAEDFEGAFRVAVKGRAQALITLRTPLIVNQRQRIAALAIKSRLPAIYDDREFVEDGGLMSYGSDLADLYRRAATYVDKILKGRKPADLPVEQPMKFEFFINLKTAKALGLTIPPEVLMRADRVIK